MAMAHTLISINLASWICVTPILSYHCFVLFLQLKSFFLQPSSLLCMLRCKVSYFLMRLFSIVTLWFSL